MLRILHLCDQNWVGTASTFVKYHNKLGNYSRMVTLSRCRTGFDEDICLNLPMMKGSRLDMALKQGDEPAARERPEERAAGQRPGVAAEKPASRACCSACATR